MKKASRQLQGPPNYCEYAAGKCDQTFDTTGRVQALVLYPSNPENIASVIKAAVDKTRTNSRELNWVTWEDLNVSGKVIFCEICKAIRFSKVVFVDVTTLNRNLMFEIGYCLGLGKPVIPIRDTSYDRDAQKFKELGFLETLGYTDFTNSDQLHELLAERASQEGMPKPIIRVDLRAPLYVVKAPQPIEGEIHLLSTIKKSSLQFRTYDTVEMPRRSLHEVRSQVAASLGIIVHMLSESRSDSLVHNARCALIAGLGMALERNVLMLQEEGSSQPIDYRDVAINYTEPQQVSGYVRTLVAQVIRKKEQLAPQASRPSAGLLQRIDLGDIAAENEIRSLRDYFVETSQYFRAKDGHARLLVGRKGSGKTAMFYAVRNSLGQGHGKLVLDLKPEGHQFTKLRELVLDKLSEGMQEHTLTAFWILILLTELANKIQESDSSWAANDPVRKERFEKIKENCATCDLIEAGDFSERLLAQVNSLVDAFGRLDKKADGKAITEMLYASSIKDLHSSITDYVKGKDQVWILFDNLDKSWPTRGAKAEDILVLKCLMEASRKLQRWFDRDGIDFKVLLFLRNDIYEHLVSLTSDKGKDSPIKLDWSDPEFFKDVFLRRITASTELNGAFDEVWNTVFTSHVDLEDSFSYILNRTLMRPRDFLNFLRGAIECAINRGHRKVEADDIVFAEDAYSNELTQSTVFEFKDVYSGIPDFIYVFLGAKVKMSKTEIVKLLEEAKIKRKKHENALSLLTWYGFFGIHDSRTQLTKYSYDLSYDLKRLHLPLRLGSGSYVIHPAFRTALACVDNTQNLP